MNYKKVKDCKYCHEEWGICDPKINRFTMPPGKIQFCPMCGKPSTAEAVDLVMGRLEALQDGLLHRQGSNAQCDT